MTTTAAYALAAVVLGTPALAAAVALTARHFVYRHADEVGPAIRAAGRDDLDPAAVRALAKEIAR